MHQFGAAIRAKGKALPWIGPDGSREFKKQVKIPARPFYPIINGRLTPAAEQRIATAAQRVIGKIAGESSSPA